MKTFPLVNLPYIKDPNNGDKLLAETQALLMYIAQKYGPAAGPTFEEMPDFMAMNGVVHDLIMGIMMPSYTGSSLEDVKNKVLQSRDRFASKMVLLENLFKSDDWLFKNRFTFIDIHMALFTEILVLMEKELEFEYLSEGKRTVFSAHMDRVYNQEGIKKWRSSDKFQVRPFLAPFAQWK